MACRNIIKSGDSILKKKSRKVEKFDDRLQTLLDDMKDTLTFANGVGLAAVQVGVLRRAVVVNKDGEMLELINPEIVEEKGAQREEEGCLSLPGEAGVTLRPAQVKVKAQDRNGKWHVYMAEGLMARCFCHEIDHLDGILFTQRLDKGNQ